VVLNHLPVRLFDFTGRTRPHVRAGIGRSMTNLPACRVSPVRTRSPAGPTSPPNRHWIGPPSGSTAPGWRAFGKPSTRSRGAAGAAARREYDWLTSGPGRLHRPRRPGPALHRRRRAGPAGGRKGDPPSDQPDRGRRAADRPAPAQRRAHRQVLQLPPDLRRHRDPWPTAATSGQHPQPARLGSDRAGPRLWIATKPGLV